MHERFWIYTATKKEEKNKSVMFMLHRFSRNMMDASKTCTVSLFLVGRISTGWEQMDLGGNNNVGKTVKEKKNVWNTSWRTLLFEDFLKPDNTKGNLRQS